MLQHVSLRGLYSLLGGAKRLIQAEIAIVVDFHQESICKITAPTIQQR